MFASSIISQLVAAQQLQHCSARCAAAVAAAIAPLQSFCQGSHRSAHSAVQHNLEEAPSEPGSAAHSDGASDLQRPSWGPSRALPPPDTYGLRITIKAHELIFVKMASSVIRDLVMVNLAPKSRGVVPALWRNDGVGAPWVNLALPVGDRAIPTQRTHFTVISGPHVHKTAREQFARTTHTRVIKVATNNLSELHWLLHSIKMYKFVGCELSMRISSSSYLLPTSTQQQDAAQQPLLAGHKQRFAELFRAAGLSSDPAGRALEPGRSSTTSYAALQQSLQDLGSQLHQGLLQQRMRLSASQRFARWQETAEGQAATAASAAAGLGLRAGDRSPQQQLQDMVAQQLEGSSLLAGDAAAEGSGGSSGVVSSREQALVAAVDKVLAGLKTDVLDRHKLFPYLMAYYQPGQHQVSPAQWMHAVLMYAKHRQREIQASQQEAVVQSYQQHGQASRALLLLLLQQWYRSADASSRQQLGLPSTKQQDNVVDPPELSRS